jgi:hypothetical protein
MVRILRENVAENLLIESNLEKKGVCP